MMKVGIIKAEGYNNLNEKVSKLLKITDFSIDYDRPILLKPNFLAEAELKKGVVTRPEIILSMVSELGKKSDNIRVGESSGEQSKEGTERIFKAYRLGDILKGKAELINFDKEFSWVGIKNKKVDKIMVAKEALGGQLISMPKLKTHVFTIFTGGVKNLYGCLFQKQKQIIHSKIPYKNEFAEFLIDLYQLIKPKYCLMDAIEIMEGDGPSTGDIRKLNLLIGSKDCLALDYVAMKIVGIDPMKVPLTRIAIEKGLLNPNDIEIVGEEIDNVKVNIKLPETMDASQLFLDYRYILSADKNKCRKCKLCSKFCPVNAISYNPYPVFDKKKCIRCFCCHEHCPYGAIKIEKKLSWKGFIIGLIRGVMVRLGIRKKV